MVFEQRCHDILPRLHYSLENHNKGREGEVVTYTHLALTTFTPHTTSHSQHRADGKLETASVRTCAPETTKATGNPVRLFLTQTSLRNKESGLQEVY